ncbi:MAG: hypothetical protein WAP34_03160, partial [Desulfomonilia bacterium]
PFIPSWKEYTTIHQYYHYINEDGRWKSTPCQASPMTELCKGLWTSVIHDKGRQAALTACPTRPGKRSLDAGEEQRKCAITHEVFSKGSQPLPAAFRNGPKHCSEESA